MTDNKSLYQKLFVIQGQINSISKTGYNSFKDYKYVVLKDILDQLRPVLSSVGLHLTATTYDAVTSETDARVTVEVTVTNVDFPTEQLATAATGYAKDGKGDKAIYKATTGAFKYALLLLFGLAQDDDDPEHDSAEPKGVTNSKKTKTMKTDFDDLDI
jgi:hypothetical protein